MKSRGHRPALRYARALHAVADEQRCLEAVLADTRSLTAVCAESPGFVTVLGNYLVARSQRRSLLETLLAGHVQPLTWRMVLFMEAKKRLALLPSVCAQMEVLEEHRRGILRVDVASAARLEADIEQELRGRLEGRLSHPVRLVCRQAPDLIGGFTLRVRDTLYDHSAAGALKALRRQLTTRTGKGF